MSQNECSEPTRELGMFLEREKNLIYNFVTISPRHSLLPPLYQGTGFCLPPIQAQIGGSRSSANIKVF